MTEQDPQRPPTADAAGHGAVPPPRQIPDLGFFAGTPTSGGGSGASSQFGGPPAPASQFGSPPASQFGSSPAPASQFGTAPAPFGSPAGAFPTPATPAAEGRRVGGSTSGVKLVVGGVAVVLLLVAVFGGRFAWQQFVADPVLPQTLGGMPIFTGTDVDAQLAALQGGIAEELTSDGEARVAMYTNAIGSGYVLIAVRGGSTSTDNEDDTAAFNGWSRSEHDGATCWTSPPQAGVDFGLTMCMQGFWRRGVAVMGIGATAPDPAQVADVTHEAWDAQ